MASLNRELWWVPVGVWLFGLHAADHQAVECISEWLPVSSLHLAIVATLNFKQSVAAVLTTISLPACLWCFWRISVLCECKLAAVTEKCNSLWKYWFEPIIWKICKCYIDTVSYGPLPGYKILVYGKGQSGSHPTLCILKEILDIRFVHILHPHLVIIRLFLIS